MPGDRIADACTEAVAIAKRENCSVEFAFNDQVLTATADTDPAALAQSYMDEGDRRRAAYLASPEHKLRLEAAKIAQRKKDDELYYALFDAPATMTLRDRESWEKCRAVNADSPYGNAITIYAERWARVMEGKIKKGEKLPDIADASSHLADTDGITGFMYGAAVSILAAVWVHGEELRRWHNLKTQIGTEGEKANESGGVLNPAMLNIGSKAP